MHRIAMVAAPAAAPPLLVGRLSHRVLAYVPLLKPRIVVLLTLSGAVSALVAADGQGGRHADAGGK